MRDISIYPPTLDGDSITIKRQEIKEYFHNTYSLFEKMFDVLKNDDVFYKKSELTRHPMIFYFGHTATFFINKLVNMKIIDKRINPKFESQFAIGVDEMSWDDMDESNYHWPSVNEVRKYRDEVRKLVDELIENMNFTLPITDKSDMWIILMGIEHERIHIETSSVLHRQMPLEFIKDISEFNVCQEHSNSPKNEMLKVPSTFVKLGKSKEHNLYGWDNEYGDYTQNIDEFLSSKYLVSNGEYMEFVKAGGYEDTQYWDDEGKKFLTITKAKYPTFWVKDGNVFKYRTLTSIIDMPLNWPVDVNQLEAMAFCRYKSKKDGIKYTLPSESEYMALYEYVELKDIPEFDDTKANLNFAHYFSSSPVDKFMFKEFGDVVGNVWQWSRTPIFGFDGFEVHKAYDDFSTPTFDNKHALILGSSWASSGNLIMKYSRYAFRKHFYQHAGFRYVVSNEKNNTIDTNNQDEDVSKYGEVQYGEDNFSIEYAKIASKFAINKTKALDLGCATGRATYELAKFFDSVEGVDFSARFIRVCTKLQEKGYIELSQNKKLTIQELGYDDVSEKVSFWQGDACNLKPNFNSYDAIVAINLLEELYNPLLFLDSVKDRVNKDGILILTSPEIWKKSSIEKDFELIYSQDLIINGNISKISVWKKY